MHDELAYHSGGDDSDNAIGTIFISDEINRVPNVFFRERFQVFMPLHTFVWSSEISTFLLA